MKHVNELEKQMGRKANGVSLGTTVNTGPLGLGHGEGVNLLEPLDGGQGSSNKYNDNGRVLGTGQFGHRGWSIGEGGTLTPANVVNIGGDNYVNSTFIQDLSQ